MINSKEYRLPLRGLCNRGIVIDFANRTAFTRASSFSLNIIVRTFYSLPLLPTYLALRVECSLGRLSRLDPDFQAPPRHRQI